MAKIINRLLEKIDYFKKKYRIPRRKYPKLEDDIFDYSLKSPISSNNYSDMKKLMMDDSKKVSICTVKMDKRTIENGSISYHHQCRPFITLREDDNHIYGFYTTSNIKNINFNRTNCEKYKFVIEGKKYQLKKNSLVNHSSYVCLPKENIRKYICDMDREDTERLIKYASLYRNQNLYMNSSSINIGDVIRNNNKDYFIYQIDSSNIYAFRIKNKTSQMSSKIASEDVYYSNGVDLYRMYYNDLIQCSIKDNLLLVNTFSIDDYIEIMTKRKSYKHNKKRQAKEIKSKGKQKVKTLL